MELWIYKIDDQTDNKGSKIFKEIILTLKTICMRELFPQVLNSFTLTITYN